MVQFSDISYLPTLLLRRAELVAIENLSELEKDALFPFFRVKPWYSSKKLQKSFDWLSKSLGARSYACDVDDYWLADKKKNKTGASIELRRIFSDPNLVEWYSLLKGIPTIIPCIRLEMELDRIKDLLSEEWLQERGFCFCISEFNKEHLHKLQDLFPISHNNYFVVIDAGHTRRVLETAPEVSAIAKKILTWGGVDETIPSVFLSSTSFPSGFDDYGLNSKIHLLEEQLFNDVNSSLQRENNTWNVKYGDWATTRPPSNGGGSWIPRIDYPLDTMMLTYRKRADKDETAASVCTDLAKKIVKSPTWISPPATWGHNSIYLTAEGEEYGIYDPQRNTAARVNIYLHHKLGNLMPLGGEEPFDL